MPTLVFFNQVVTLRTLLVLLSHSLRVYNNFASTGEAQLLQNGKCGYRW